MYTLKQFLQEPVIDDARNEKVYSVPEEVDYATACSVEKLVQYFADQRVNINKAKNIKGGSVKTESGSCQEDLENIFSTIGNILVNVLEGKTPEQVACLVRKTTYKNREAIAIRWDYLGDVGLSKADLFSELSCHKNKSKASDTREFRQDNGQIKKGCRCTVVLTEAFSEEILKSLKRSELVINLSSYHACNK